MQSIIFITACMAFYVPLPHSPPYDCRICLCKSDQSGRFVSFRWWWCWCLRFVSIIFHCQTLTETSVIEEEDDEGETLKTLSFTYNSVYVWFTCTTNFISHIILVHSHRDPHTLSAFYIQSNTSSFNWMFIESRFIRIIHSLNSRLINGIISRLVYFAAWPTVWMYI